MKPTKADQDGPETDAPPAGDAPIPGDGQQPRTGRHMMTMNPGHLESTGTSIDMLTHVLSRQLGRTVVDKTGLAGEYDFALDYTPDNMPMPPHGAPEEWGKITKHKATREGRLSLPRSKSSLG